MKKKDLSDDPKALKNADKVFQHEEDKEESKAVDNGKQTS